jgi:hypothetical protein
MSHPRAIRVNAASSLAVSLRRDFLFAGRGQPKGQSVRVKVQLQIPPTTQGPPETLPSSDCRDRKAGPSKRGMRTGTWRVREKVSVPGLAQYR